MRQRMEIEPSASKSDRHGHNHGVEQELFARHSSSPSRSPQRLADRFHIGELGDGALPHSHPPSPLIQVMAGGDPLLSSSSTDGLLLPHSPSTPQKVTRRHRDTWEGGGRWVPALVSSTIEQASRAMQWWRVGSGWERLDGSGGSGASGGGQGTRDRSGFIDSSSAPPPAGCSPSRDSRNNSTSRGRGRGRGSGSGSGSGSGRGSDGASEPEGEGDASSSSLVGGWHLLRRCARVAAAFFFGDERWRARGLALLVLAFCAASSGGTLEGEAGEGRRRGGGHWGLE